MLFEFKYSNKKRSLLYVLILGNGQLEMDFKYAERDKL